MTYMLFSAHSRMLHESSLVLCGSHDLIIRFTYVRSQVSFCVPQLLEDCGTALQLPEPPPPAQQQPHASADSGSGSALQPQPGSPSSGGSSSAQTSQLQREEQPPAQLDQQWQQQRQQEQLGAQGCSPAAASDSRQRQSTTAAGQPAVTGSPGAASPAPPASESQSAAAGQLAAQADTDSTLGGGCSDPVGYVAAFPARGGPLPGARPASARLLISYMGAMLGARASAAAFVEEAARCYRCSTSARRLCLSKIRTAIVNEQTPGLLSSTYCACLLAPECGRASCNTPSLGLPADSTSPQHAASHRNLAAGHP